MVDKLDQLFGFQEKALQLRSQRHQILASNIANADTPNYKARDFDFQSALQKAVGQQSGNTLPMTATASGPQIVAFPFQSVKCPPASSRIGSMGAQSHGLSNGSTMTSTRPVAASACP